MKTPTSSLSLLALAALCGLIAPAAVRADDDANLPTYYKDIVSIFQAKCMDCHRPSGTNLGGIMAPMSLTSYEETRPWVKSIGKVVKTGEMPPWHATNAFHGVFRNERTLSDAQADTIMKWVAAGAPEGNPADAPPAKTWPEGEWSIGKPDLILSFPKPFVVRDEVQDLNNFFAVDIPTDQVPEDKYITAIEFKPGSPVVHHILGFVRPPRTSGEGMQMIGGIAPGSSPINTINSYGFKLYTGSKFIFQMHYHKEPGPGTAVEDVSKVAFRFADKPVHRLFVEAIGDPQRLYVPAGAEDYKIMSRRKWDRDFLVAGYLPHMHLRGVYSKYEAITPDGKREVLLETPKWNFNWQMPYEYPQPRRFPAGTIIEATMGYNNSKSNPANPDPTANLVFAEETTDEMNLAWITWGYAEPNDSDKAPKSAIGGGNDDLEPLDGGPPPEMVKRHRGRMKAAMEGQADVDPAARARALQP